MEPSKEQYNLSFSKSGSKLAVWNKSQLKLYLTTNNIEFLSLNNQSLSLVEFYEESEILFLVGSGEVPQSSQRILSIYNCKSNSILSELGFEHTIKSVFSNLIRIIVASDEKIFILKTENFKCIACVNDFNIIQNVCLSTNIEYCLMAYTNNESQGYVHIFDCFNGNSVNVVYCHKSNIAVLSFSCTGKILATASFKGTIIKLFDSVSGEPLQQFQRGINIAKIFVVLFINNDQDLVVTSSTGTLHIFQIGVEQGVSRVLSAVSYVLPENCSSHLKSGQSVVKMTTGFEGRNYACGVNGQGFILAFDENLKYSKFSYANRDFKLLDQGKLNFV